MSNQQDQSVQAGFRSSLEDFVVIAKALSSSCHSTNDLIQVVELAIENDGQLDILMTLTANRQQTNKGFKK